jgi:hypothetical protein
MPAVAVRIADFGMVSRVIVYHLSDKSVDDLELTSADSD